MRRLFIGIFFVFLSVGATIGYRYLSIKYEAPFIPNPSATTLQPPRKAMTATLTQSTGVVKHWVRGTKEATTATPSGTIVQGESILTEDGTALISLSTLGAITLDEHTQIDLINVTPDMFVVSQPAGTASYTTISQPLSIRVAGTLVQLVGDATISHDPTLTISTHRGSVKLAILSDENITNVWDIQEGQTARVSGSDTVTIR
jgi:hypothetical protein